MAARRRSSQSQRRERERQEREEEEEEEVSEKELEQLRQRVARLARQKQRANLQEYREITEDCALVEERLAQGERSRDLLETMGRCQKQGFWPVVAVESSGGREDLVNLRGILTQDRGFVSTPTQSQSASDLAALKISSVDVRSLEKIFQMVSTAAQTGPERNEGLFKLMMEQFGHRVAVIIFVADADEYRASRSSLPSVLTDPMYMVDVNNGVQQTVLALTIDRGNAAIEEETPENRFEDLDEEVIGVRADASVTVVGLIFKDNQGCTQMALPFQCKFGVLRRYQKRYQRLCLFDLGRQKTYGWGANKDQCDACFDPALVSHLVAAAKNLRITNYPAEFICWYLKVPNDTQFPSTNTKKHAAPTPPTNTEVLEALHSWALLATDEEKTRRDETRKLFDGSIGQGTNAMKLIDLLVEMLIAAEKAVQKETDCRKPGFGIALLAALKSKNAPAPAMMAAEKILATQVIKAGTSVSTLGPNYRPQMAGGSTPRVMMLHQPAAYFGLSRVSGRGNHPYWNTRDQDWW